MCLSSFSQRQIGLTRQSLSSYYVGSSWPCACIGEKSEKNLFDEVQFRSEASTTTKSKGYVSPLVSDKYIPKVGNLLQDHAAKSRGMSGVHVCVSCASAKKRGEGREK